MSDSLNLQVLAVHRDALLLAEVAALLHDVGKFCNLHIEAHAQGGTRKWANDHAYKAIVDNPASQIRLSSKASSIRKPDALKNVLNAQSPKAADFLDKSLKDFLTNNSLSLFGESETYTLAELIMLGTPGFAADPNRSMLLDGKSGWLPAVLGVCHSEAHVDKEDPAQKEGQQVWPDVYISNAFGFEKEKVVVDASSKSLDARLRALQISREVILNEFAYSLGDTRRPVNEVLLSDWTWIVACLFKSALAGALLTNKRFDIRRWKDKIIDHDLRWRILRVNFDVLGLYAKAIKIADLLAYQRTVEDACEAVKQLVEDECPLGNEIYRDTTGIYFTFPDLDLPADLAQEIRRRIETIDLELAPRIAVERSQGNTATEQLKRMLAEARKKAHNDLIHPFAPENLSPCWQQQWDNLPDGKWEVCPICRLRPMKEGQEACETCLNRRSSRIGAWKSDPSQTIWIDEIADHNGRVALIVGKFGLDDWLSGDLVQTMLVRAIENDPGKCVPKNPSPARLRRVWETCQRFWTETVDGILNQYPYASGMANAALRRARVALVPDPDRGWREGIPYDGTINGQAISLFWLREENHFVTISNLQLAAGKARDLNELVAEWHGKTVHVVASDRPNERKEFTIARVNMLTDAKCGYTPSLLLLSSPDQFLALMPAIDALEIAEKIHQEYQEQFGKVQNRLPLFLGLVFFQRKMPLMAAMDTARRMLETRVDSEQWTVDGVNVDSGERVLKLKRDGQEMTMRVSTTMGDGSEDKWYPYFFVEQFVDGTLDDRAYRFQHNGRWLVHVNDLREGDVVRVTPSRFAYLFLESAARRFAFNPQKDTLLLDELPRLQDMWQVTCQSPDMTDTRLQAIHALFESRWQAWDLDEAGADSTAFRHLVETTLKRDKIRGVTVDDVVNGRFRRCLDLYLHVLKRRVSDEKKQEEHDERQFETANA